MSNTKDGQNNKDNAKVTHERCGNDIITNYSVIPNTNKPKTRPDILPKKNKSKKHNK